MKRAKHVFKTSEIPHLWAHQTQDSARNSQGNLYFSGPTIYSYGSHFPIASHVTNKRGEKAVLVTTRTYSPTTSGHVSAVRSSIPRDVLTFDVPRVMINANRYGNDADHAHNLDHFVAESKDALARAVNGRKYGESESLYLVNYGIGQT
jgi:hypothetical protein